MRKTVGIAIIALGVVLAAGVVIYGLTRPPTRPPANEVAPAATTPTDALKGELQVEGASVSKTDAQGHPLWSLQAGTKVTLNPEQKQATGKDVHWSLQAAGKTAWLVDAPSLVIDYTTGRLTFTDGVHVSSADGKQQVKVRNLTYEPDSKQLVGTGGAEFRSQQATVTGERVVVDTQAHKVKLSGGVRAHVGP
ncbi:MAG TPA: LPS export ABC transporter periplasmic protein LptC [Armatimonadota bacterium]|jgi:LPS export ABC transporter protein LptC